VSAFGKRGINPATQKSFLLMKELKETVSLEDFCKEWKTKPPAFPLKRKIINEVARIARTMHQNGINHRDFYICHFLLSKLENFKLYLIDLHRASIHRRLRQRWIIKDLAGLYFSSKGIGLTQRDLYRFIKAYHQQPLRAIIATESNLWSKTVARGEKLHGAHAIY
ncbi:MAG TPA: lipopolysaccharide core heptose(I) kinase RfaP, partial [Gammaproteobacteria bacterium]|nr:lipopolysaccharide core heptose(I) kinase RfaP [Gammaproteobacteria bacterium]